MDGQDTPHALENHAGRTAFIPRPSGYHNERPSAGLSRFCCIGMQNGSRVPTLSINSFLTPLPQCDILDLYEYERTMKKNYRQVLHMEEEESPPKVSLKPSSIDFGTVGYLRSVTKGLEVRNIGKVRKKENRVHILLLSIRFDPGRTLDTMRVPIRASGDGGANLCVCFWL